MRGFRIHAETDNALYLVCVVTRGSSFISVENKEEELNRDIFQQGEEQKGEEEEVG